MLFNSFEFLFLFLPVTFLVFVYLARTGNTEAQIIWLIFASLIFYGSWNPIFVGLIVFSAVVNFFVGRILAANFNPRGKRSWLTAGVIFNLGLLGYYKYANFFVDNLNALGLWFIPLPNVVLPLAISFFTFQQIAYLVDVYRGECKEYKFIHYALFVAFFPQLIAGPIVHHEEMMPQFEKLRRREDFWSDISVGLTILTIGLFKKVVLADSLAQYADPVFAAAERGEVISTADAWIANFCFSFQIYFDFSGYSDMAIGSARIFGIRLPENFRSPYKSTNIIEFWRRWHMTLSRFLRDYLYFSLGGNRLGSVKRYRNLLLTMLLGGLWHGAAWTFVVWGAMHGAYLCINHGWRALYKQFDLGAVLNDRLLTPIYFALTVLAWSLAFVVFRAESFQSALTIITTAFIGNAGSVVPLLTVTAADSIVGQIYSILGLNSIGYMPVYSLLAVSALIICFMPNTQQYMSSCNPVIVAKGSGVLAASRLQWRPVWITALLSGVMLSISLLSLSTITEFIYFQF